MVPGQPNTHHNFVTMSPSPLAQKFVMKLPSLTFLLQRIIQGESKLGLDLDKL